LEKILFKRDGLGFKTQASFGKKSLYFHIIGEISQEVKEKATGSGRRKGGRQKNPRQQKGYAE
jgi:hypothetical protein